MARIACLMIILLSFSSVAFGQNQKPEASQEMKELTEAIEKMIEEFNIDSMFIEIMNNDMPKNLKNFIDTSAYMGMFSDSTTMMFDFDDMNWQFDSTDWNRMFDESMKILQDMDFSELEQMMESFDMSTFDKIFEDFEIMIPEIDSIQRERIEKKKKEKELKKI